MRGAQCARSCRDDVRLRWCRGVLHDAHGCPSHPGALLRAGADDLHTAPVREQGVVCRQQLFRQRELEPRRVDAVAIPELDEDLGLVQGHPVRDAVGELVDHHGGVVREPVRDALVEPPAATVQRRGQVPVEQGCEWRDVRSEQAVNQPAVEVEALGVYITPALRDDAGPCDAEAVRPQAHGLHEPHVGLHAVVVVASNFGVMVAPDIARSLAEVVPDGWTAAVRGGCALDLERRGGCAPCEVGREGHGVSLRAGKRGWLVGVRPRASGCAPPFALGAHSIFHEASAGSVVTTMSSPSARGGLRKTKPPSGIRMSPSARAVMRAPMRCMESVSVPYDV